MELIKNYRDNETLRKSFHALAMKTYGLDFEDWYENGYWGEAYTPYSIVEAGRIVANVSVNTTDFILDGSRKHFIQLGTVMTDEAYRKRGYGRRLMEEVEKDYAGKTDGIYLFANDSVLDLKGLLNTVMKRQLQRTEKGAYTEFPCMKKGCGTVLPK